MIPALGYGTWQLAPDRKGTGNSSQADAIEAIKEGVMVGYRHIDSAYMYDTEKVIGAALKELFSACMVDREDHFIVTKVWNNFHSRERAVE
ncbi:unnamed protein product, partial [Oppiella nova]